MKKLSSLFIAILFVTLGFSQTYQDDLELIQSLYGMEKKEVVDAFVELDPNEEGTFWELYAEYESKRKDLGKKKYEVLWNYVNDYGTIRAADAEIIMNEILPLRAETDKLIRYLKACIGSLIGQLSCMRENLSKLSPINKK